MAMAECSGEKGRDTGLRCRERRLGEPAAETLERERGERKLVGNGSIQVSPISSGWEGSPY